MRRAFQALSQQPEDRLV